MLATTLPAGAQTLQPESGTLVVVNKRVNTASIIDVTSGETFTEVIASVGRNGAAGGRFQTAAAVPETLPKQFT